MVDKLRRSSLYVPGDSEKMLHKSAVVPADMLLLNLEDGVASSRKESARWNVVNAMKSCNYGRLEIVVRVNSLATELGMRDLAAVVSNRPAGVCLPKIENAAQIQAADTAILELEIEHGIPKGSVGVHAMIESAAGVLHSADIATASPRMSSLIFGSADYARDIRCQPGEDRVELLLALQMIVNAARLGGIDAIDAPCFDLSNSGLLRKEATQARRLGFDGKSALHPGQLPEINNVFGVTADEIAWAERVIAELNEAEKGGRALTTLDGKLIDNPHRAAAERILSSRGGG